MRAESGIAESGLVESGHLESGIAVVGGGSHAANVVALFEKLDRRPVVCVDEFRNTPLNGVPVLRSVDLTATDRSRISRFVVAMSDADHRDAAIARLYDRDVSPDQILAIDDDPALQTVRTLTERFGDVAVEALVRPDGETLSDVERRLCLDDWDRALGQSVGTGATVGLCCFGRGGGFSGHLAPLLPRLIAADHRVVAISDEVDGTAGLDGVMPRLTMSAAAARSRRLVDVAIAAHVHPCSPPGVPRVTLSHTLHDLNLTADYHAARWGMSRPHFLFAPTQASVDSYLRTIAASSITTPICVIPGGYPHLDAAIHAADQYSGPVDSVVYAPTLSIWDDPRAELASSLDLGVDLVRAVLAEVPDVGVVIRPHPGDLRLHELHGSEVTPLGRLLAFAAGEPRCSVDRSRNYLPTYLRSAAMISDTSSTAMTFAFATGRPAFFLSPRDEALLSAFDEPVGFFADRHHIGQVSTTVDDTVAALGAHLRCGEPQRSIGELRDRSVFNIGRSADYLVDNLSLIVEGERHGDWLYLNS